MKEKRHHRKRFRNRRFLTSGKKLTPVGIIFLTAAGLAMAYLTDRTRIVNQISVGSNTVSIKEEFEPPRKQETGDNIFKKKIQIENTDKTDSFIRVFMEFSDSSIKDLAQISPDGENWYPASEYISSSFQKLPENWIYLSEAEDPLLGGYYYYTQPVKAKETTVPLADRILVTYSDASQIRDFDILVTADSIQTYINEENEDGSFTAKDVSEEAGSWKMAWTEYMERR